jgi:hypothetical protein
MHNAMSKYVFRCFGTILLFILTTWLFNPTYAATAITVTSANKVVTIGLSRSGPLNTTLATLDAFIQVESANKIINTRSVQPPATLVSLYTARYAAIFVESADKLVGLGAVTPASPLRDTYSTIKKRITVVGADHVGLKSVVPIILDGGVPTSTMLRAALLPATEPTSTPTMPAETMSPTVPMTTTPLANETQTPAP